MHVLDEKSLNKHLDFLLKIRVFLKESDLKAQDAVNQFHKDTNDKYKISGEELQEIYPRLIRLIDSVSYDLSQIKTISFSQDDY